MTYVTLALLAEDLPNEILEPGALATSFRAELLDHAQQYGDFKSDRLVSCIEQETAAAIRYLAESPRTNMDESVSTLSPLSAPERDPRLEARDKWIYDEACKGTPWPQILRQLAKNTQGWWKIGTVSGLISAAYRYAYQHNLPTPSRRLRGRPPL